MRTCRHLGDFLSPHDISTEPSHFYARQEGLPLDGIQFDGDASFGIVDDVPALESSAIASTISGGEIAFHLLPADGYIEASLSRDHFLIVFPQEVGELGGGSGHVCHQQFHLVISFWSVNLIGNLSFTPGLVNGAIYGIRDFRSGAAGFSAYVAPTSRFVWLVGQPRQLAHGEVK
mgnify:CR=1 FL=1